MACVILGIVLAVASQAPPYAMTVSEFKKTEMHEAKRYRIDASVAKNTNNEAQTGRLCDPNACIDVVIDSKKHQRFKIGTDVIVNAYWKSGKLHVTDVVSRCQRKSETKVTTNSP